MKKHILVFDSGLGGTTVLHDIQKLLPEFTYSYAMDNGAFPYGNKASDYLIDRCTTYIRQLIDVIQPDAIVIACNTASTLTLAQLRQSFDTPFIGVVPALKPAAAVSQTKIIALLATQATVGREYVDHLQKSHAADCEVLRFGSQDLVHIAETKMLGETVDMPALDQAISELLHHPKAAMVDTVVLGCTHFPALIPELKQLWPSPRFWVDSGEAIARRVREITNDLPESESVASATLLYSGDIDDTLAASFHRFGINQARKIEI